MVPDTQFFVLSGDKGVGRCYCLISEAIVCRSATGTKTTNATAGGEHHLPAISNSCRLASILLTTATPRLSRAPPSPFTKERTHGGYWR